MSLKHFLGLLTQKQSYTVSILSSHYITYDINYHLRGEKILLNLFLNFCLPGIFPIGIVLCATTDEQHVNMGALESIVFTLVGGQSGYS